MSVNLSQLVMEGVIFHLVPQRPTNPEEAKKIAPSLSDVEQALPDALSHYLRDQVIATFTRSRQAAEVDPDLDSPLPAATLAFLEDAGSEEERRDRFLALSKEAACLLYERQRAVAPDGLLVAIRGRVGTERVACFAKLEQQSGLSFDITNEGGTQQVVVALEDGLVLTEDTAVFKAAVFSAKGRKRDRHLEAIVSDEQSGRIYQAPISDYWLRAFLGCKYSNNADVQTRAFVDAINKVVNRDLTDIEDRDALHEALSVELRNNNTAIDPLAFVETHIPADLQDRALQRLRDAGAPTTRFPKGSDVVDHVPKNTWYEFADGTRVKVPLDQTVEVSQGDGEQESVLTIRGRIVRIR